MIVSQRELEHNAQSALNAVLDGLEPTLQNWSLVLSHNGEVNLTAVGRAWVAVPYRGGKWVSVTGRAFIGNITDGGPHDSGPQEV